MNGYFTKDLNDKLKQAARVAIRNVLGTKNDERVLIVTNPEEDVLSVSRALYVAAAESEANPVMCIQPVKSQLEFATDEVMAALRSDPDVILSISAEKLGKDSLAIKDPIKVGDRSYDHYFHYLLGEDKIRSFWSPSVTRDMFERCVPIDYVRLRGDCSRLKELLDRGDEVRITSPSGTDVTIGIRGRRSKSDDGDFTKPGSGGNLPAGESFISPELGSSEGKIVFDGSIASDKGIIIIKDPIECVINGNLVTEINGGEEARKLEDTIRRAKESTIKLVEEGKLEESQRDHYLTNTENLGELGIGLNRMARIVGNMLEDEKVYGTCHMAIGANYDNDANALIHLDGLVKKPTIEISSSSFSEIVMKKGDLII